MSENLRISFTLVFALVLCTAKATDDEGTSVDFFSALASGGLYKGAAGPAGPLHVMPTVVAPRTHISPAPSGRAWAYSAAGLAPPAPSPQLIRSHHDAPLAMEVDSHGDLKLNNRWRTHTAVQPDATGPSSVPTAQKAASEISEGNTPPAPGLPSVSLPSKASSVAPSASAAIPPAPGAAPTEGPRGSKGAAGPPGDQGAKGNNGGNGPQGLQGTLGSQGDKGKQGATGDNGDQGPKGTSGTIGDDGPLATPFDGSMYLTKDKYNKAGLFTIALAILLYVCGYCNFIKEDSSEESKKSVAEDAAVYPGEEAGETWDEADDEEEWNKNS